MVPYMKFIGFVSYQGYLYAMREDGKIYRITIDYDKPWNVKIELLARIDIEEFGPYNEAKWTVFLVGATRGLRLNSSSQ